MPLPDIDSTRNWGADAWENAEPIVEPTTELNADVAREMAADVAAMTHTVTRARVRFQCAALVTAPQPATIWDHESVWGSLAPVAPVVSQTATGLYVLTWNETQTDELGNSHRLNCRFPSRPAIMGSLHGDALIVVFTANSITLQTFNSAGVGDSLDGCQIIVSW